MQVVDHSGALQESWKTQEGDRNFGPVALVRRAGARNALPPSQAAAQRTSVQECGTE